jgi:hypothetical protein
MSVHREGDVVRIKGHGALHWRVLHLGRALGVHYQLARVVCLDPKYSPKTVPVADLVAIPVDLEDFPTAPV